MRNLMGSPHLKLKIADRVTLFFFLFSLLFFLGKVGVFRNKPIEMSGTLINPKTNWISVGFPLD